MAIELGTSVQVTNYHIFTNRPGHTMITINSGELRGKTFRVDGMLESVNHYPIIITPITQVTLLFWSEQHLLLTRPHHSGKGVEQCWLIDEMVEQMIHDAQSRSQQSMLDSGLLGHAT